MRAAIVLTSLLFATVAAAEDRQLWRIVDIQTPLKGYLLGPGTGATDDANFESCAGTRIFVEQSKLERERGSCDGTDKGTFAVYPGQVEGIALFSLDQKQIGIIKNASTNAQGTVDSIDVQSDSGLSFTVKASDLDWQRIGNGENIQALFVGDAQKLATEK